MRFKIWTACFVMLLVATGEIGLIFGTVQDDIEL